MTATLIILYNASHARNALQNHFDCNVILHSLCAFNAPHRYDIRTMVPGHLPGSKYFRKAVNI